jgi:hypothetical protein
MTKSLLTFAATLLLFSSITLAKKSEDKKTKVEEARKPAQVFSLSECNKKSEIDLATELLDFIGNGGLAGQGQSRCQEALKLSSFAVVEPIEGDVVPRLIRIQDGDKIEIVKVKEIIHELGFKTKTWEVQYVIHTKGKRLKGQLEFSRSINEEDVKNFGCGYLRAEPDQLFIRKSCEIR